jgi:5-(carboxyamino)imidazole ribonucleotide mutase
VAIGNGKNAGLLAVRILGASDSGLRRQLAAHQRRLAAESRAKNRKL